MYKNILSITRCIAVIMLLFTFSCKKQEANGEAAKDVSAQAADQNAVKELPPPTEKEVGYAFGVMMGDTLKEDLKVTVDYNEVLKGLKAVANNKEVNLQEARNILQRAAETAYKKLAEENMAKEIEFLEKNAKEAGVKTTESGLQYKVITEGSGVIPASTDTVKVHYKGTLLDGTVFDSSYDRGQPVEFPLNAVIPGWSEGLRLMKTGSKYMLYLPSKIAYGEQGVPRFIPPNSVLTFEIELLEIVPSAPLETDKASQSSKN